MASTPAFAATPRLGTVAVSTSASTSYTSPANPTSVIVGGNSGTKIEEIVFQGIGTTVAGIINVFVVTSSTFYLVDQVLVDAITSGTTTILFRTRRQYQNLLLPSNAWSLQVASTVGSQLVEVTAFGGDF